MRLLKEAIDESLSLSSMQTFVNMAETWREHVKGDENGIFNVTPVYLARRYKRWRQTASKKEAINTPECQRLMIALEHIPLDLSNEMDDELNTVDVELGTDVEIVPTNTAIHGPTVHRKQSKQQGQKKGLGSNAIGVLIHYAVVSIMEGGAKLLIHQQVSIVGLRQKR